MTHPEPRLGPGALKSFGRAPLAHPVSAALPLDFTAPGCARRLVAEALYGTPLSTLIDAASLVASELVTNALRHGRDRLDLDVWCGPSFLQLGVGDDGPGEPVVRRPTPFEDGGRGLRLVDALVSMRSTTRDGAGKTVWCQLDIEGPASGAGRPPEN